MEYKHIIDEWNENRYLISMTPIAQIVRLGMDSGMNGDSTVLEIIILILIQRIEKLKSMPLRWNYPLAV